MKRRNSSSYRAYFGVFVGLLIVAYGFVAGHRTQPRNIYREQLPVYVLRPATLQPALPTTAVPKKKVVTRPKRVTNEVLCLAQVIFFESGFEPQEGIEAVAAVVFNRTESKYYPHTICGVVYQAKQFSWTADYSKWTRIPPKKYMDMARAFLANRDILQESYEHLTHFHHISIDPQWGKPITYAATYGQHKFYAWRPLIRNDVSSTR